MSLPSVLLIDAGLGNVGSVQAAFQRQNCNTLRSSQPPSEDHSSSFSHAVLPGVGSFAAGRKALSIRGWDRWLCEYWAPSQRPLLGICLGMQLLASDGYEGVTADSVATPGLGLVPGSVQRLPLDPGLVLPHVGWNEVQWQSAAEPLSKGLPQGGDFYFVHSYAFQVADPDDALATSNYGETFTAAVGRAGCFGMQFHPEKSQKLGRKLLSNFLELTNA